MDIQADDPMACMGVKVLAGEKGALRVGRRYDPGGGTIPEYKKYPGAIHPLQSDGLRQRQKE